MVVPPHLREAYGKREIQFSLRTSDLAEARRLCALHQKDWLTKFASHELEVQRDVERVCTEAIDTHFQPEAARYGGIDRVLQYEALLEAQEPPKGGLFA